MTSIDISGSPVHKLSPGMLSARVSRFAEEPSISKTLSIYLNDMKDRIDGVRDQWDKFKRFTNAYEFVHTQHPIHKVPVCPLNPLSRSFYKLVEIIAHYELLAGDRDAPWVTFSFAEGPGGFLQALLTLRTNTADTYHGMTLSSHCKSTVPGWRKARDFLAAHSNVNVYAGLTADGNLLSAPNLIHCFKVHQATCNFVTGDGGFDFTADFANQEAKSLPLAFAQTAFALAVQSRGGTFVLKLFDTMTAASIDVLYLLCCAYKKVDLYKPNTSRSANSERYVVCRSLKAPATSNLIYSLARIIDKLAHGWLPIRFLNVDIPYSFITALQEANAVFGQMQIESISSTLSLIRRPAGDRIDALIRTNTQRCIKWCHRHALPCTRSARRNLHSL